MPAGTRRVGRLLNKLDKKFIIIAVAGGSCSGKTSFAKRLSERYGTAILSMDDYYRGISHGKNFDVPSAIDLLLLRKHLRQLSSGRKIMKPVYDFSKHTRKGYETFGPARIVVLEGIFALHKSLAGCSDIRVFINAGSRVRLARRIKRDVAERGRTIESVLKQWRVVAKMYRNHVLPTKKSADVIVRND